MTQNEYPNPDSKPNLNVKRSVILVPNGLKVIYNYTDGTFLASIDVFGPSAEAQAAFPGLLADIANGLAAAKTAAEALKAAEEAAKEPGTSNLEPVTEGE